MKESFSEIKMWFKRGDIHNRIVRIVEGVGYQQRKTNKVCGTFRLRHRKLLQPLFKYKKKFFYNMKIKKGKKVRKKKIL